MNQETPLAAAPRRSPRWRLAWDILMGAVNKYVETDAELRAASFGYYAFFAIFPLLLLFVYIGTLFLGDQKEVVDRVLEFVNVYLPRNPNEQDIVADTLTGALHARSKVGLVAFLALIWSSLRFFQSLMHGVNRAWKTQEYSWWRLPIANLVMVGILGGTLLLGMVIPLIMKAIESYWQAHRVEDLGLFESLFHLIRLTIPSLILFLGLWVFYKYAPRRKTMLREVWGGALLTTVLLLLLQKGFVTYWVNFARFNYIYGTLGSVVAVLMWIYLSGSLIIFGGCWCAAQHEALHPPSPADPSVDPSADAPASSP